MSIPPIRTHWRQIGRQLLTLIVCLGLVASPLVAVTTTTVAGASPAQPALQSSIDETNHQQPTISAPATVAGQSGATIGVTYNLSNVDNQSGITLVLTNASTQVVVNKTASDYDGGTANPSGTEVTYFRPSNPAPTVAYDIRSNVSAGETFTLTAAVRNETGTQTDTATVTVEIQQNAAPAPAPTPSSDLNVTAAVRQPGAPGSQATVAYTITNASSQSGVVVNLNATPSAVSVNKTASDYGAGSANPNGTEVTFFQPSDIENLTVAYEIAANASASTTFNVSVSVQNSTGVLDTTTAEIGNAPLGLDRFDRSGDGVIQGSEVLDAIGEFENGTLTGSQVLEIISAFERGTVPSQV